MFTGIITDSGTLTHVHDEAGAKHLSIQTCYDLDDVAIGASIACNGICLTVTEKSDDNFHATASAETITKTTLGAWRAGDVINLERALRMGDELGGHLVSGHVDGIATIQSIAPIDLSYQLTINAPKALAKFIAPKGSVALNGISLTVNAVEAEHFDVNIIPHTWENTNLQTLNAGDALNIEVDLFARYIARQMEVAA
ncbi:MAG: riboflavin synthase [Rickettsiales bacterium]|nr:riboflavin synthase [Rickettsiales bacterium]